MNEQDGVDFLLVEHGKTIDLIQHYENLRVSHLRFVFSFHTVAAIVAFAIIFLSDMQSNNLELTVQIFLGCLLTFTFAVGVATVCMLSQNRSDFVNAVRHANTIRGTLFKRGSLASRIQSVLPTNPDEPKMYNPMSPHLVVLLLLEVVNSISLGFGILFLSMAVNTSPWLRFYLPINCGLIVLIGQFLLVKYVFLKEKS